jgi:hypothetical protein
MLSLKERHGRLPGGLRSQVEDEGAAYQTECDARRNERNQHGTRKARQNTE